MKFKCLDKDGNFIGTVNGDEEEDALANAQQLSDKVCKVELVPGQVRPAPKKGIVKRKKAVMSALEVQAAAAKRKKAKNGDGQKA